MMRVNPTQRQDPIRIRKLAADTCEVLLSGHATMPSPHRYANSGARAVRRAAITMMACLCLGTAGAIADDGFYAGIGAGLLFLEDSDTGARPSEAYPSPLDATTTHDRGTAFSGVFGYRFSEGLRIEGELGYRKAGFHEITLREPGSLAALLPPEQRQDPAVLEGLKGTHPAEGDLSSVSLMVSLYYDIDLASGLKPYVGGGIGLSRVSMKASTAGTQTTDDDDTVFAYQFGAGIGYGIGTWSGRPVIVSLDFRHHATADPTLTGSVTGTPFDIGVGGNHVGVGLRIGF